VNLVHLHLLMNHLPVLGVPFGLILLCAGMLRRSDELKKAALLVFVVASLLLVPVYFTGEPAEEGVENLPGVTETYIERHEDLALFSLISAALLGVISLVAVVALVRGHNGLSAPALPLVLALAVICSLSLGLTASAGGEIRHTEIRQNARIEP
jgi:hypothetical protein